MAHDFSTAANAGVGRASPGNRSRLPDDGALGRQDTVGRALPGHGEALEGRGHPQGVGGVQEAERAASLACTQTALTPPRSQKSGSIFYTIGAPPGCRPLLTLPHGRRSPTRSLRSGRKATQECAVSEARKRMLTGMYYHRLPEEPRFLASACRAGGNNPGYPRRSRRPDALFARQFSASSRARRASPRPSASLSWPRPFFTDTARRFFSTRK